MTQSPIAEHEQFPWTARAYAMVSMPPVRVGLWIGAVLLTTLLVSEWALGRYALMLGEATAVSPIREFRIAVVHCLLTAYAPTAYVVLIHRTVTGGIRREAQSRAAAGRSGSLQPGATHHRVRSDSLG